MDSKSQDLLGAVMMLILPDDRARKQEECTRHPQMRSKLQQYNIDDNIERWKEMGNAGDNLCI